MGLPPPLMVPRDTLRPPSADNPRVGLLMSALAHAGLLVALTLGVSWRAEEPAAVSAELWAATPQIAAPPRAEAAAETPPPPPVTRARAAEPPPPAQAEREAQIAVEKAQRLRDEKEREQARLAEEKRQREKAEKAEKERADQKKAEREKQERLEREKAEKAEAARKDKAADAQREKLRQDQIRRMNEQLGGGPSGNGGPGSTGSAARDAGPSATYAGRILARIKPNIVFTDEIGGNPRAEVEMTVGADGHIISQRIRQSSGVKAWDDAVLRAVERTAVLPRDTDGKVPPSIVIGFRPRD